MARSVLFSRYRLLEPVGTGGSAEVWRALDTKTGDEVAVKRLHPIVLADEAGRARLRREFDALRSVDEPHIVRVRDLHVGRREAAIVLDFIPGPSLAQRMASQSAGRPALSPEEAVGVVADVAAALSAAHEAGIIHRDVTPGNILLALDGEARLTDFGIAHGDAETTSVTATGQVMGTMRYLAPEQLRGAASTPASDLHSLAAVAYEMLAGRHAYEVATPVALAEAQVDGPPPIEGVSPAVYAVVRQGLAVDPAARPASVAAFASALEVAVADEPTAMVAVPLLDDRTTPMAVPPAADVAVASPSRAAVTHGALPPAAGLADRAASGLAQRRLAGIPAPAVAVIAMLLAIGVLAAATSSDPGAAFAPTARPSAIQRAPAPTPVPTPAPKHHDHGKGNGKDKGDG